MAESDRRRGGGQESKRVSRETIGRERVRESEIEREKLELERESAGFEEDRM